MTFSSWYMYYQDFDSVIWGFVKMRFLHLYQRFRPTH